MVCLEIRRVRYERHAVRRVLMPVDDGGQHTVSPLGGDLLDVLSMEDADASRADHAQLERPFHRRNLPRPQRGLSVALEAHPSGERGVEWPLDSIGT